VDSADCGVSFEWNAREGMVRGAKAINQDILLLGKARHCSGQPRNFSFSAKAIADQMKALNRHV